MDNFKIGDIVIAMDTASKYTYTTPGTKWKVTKLIEDSLILTEIAKPMHRWEAYAKDFKTFPIKPLEIEEVFKVNPDKTNLPFQIKEGKHIVRKKRHIYLHEPQFVNLTFLINNKAKTYKLFFPHFVFVKFGDDPLLFFYKEGVNEQNIMDCVTYNPPLPHVGDDYPGSICMNDEYPGDGGYKTFYHHFFTSIFHHRYVANPTIINGKAVTETEKIIPAWAKLKKPTDFLFQRPGRSLKIIFAYEDNDEEDEKEK